MILSACKSWVFLGALGISRASLDSLSISLSPARGLSESGEAEGVMTHWSSLSSASSLGNSAVLTGVRAWHVPEGESVILIPSLLKTLLFCLSWNFLHPF